MTQADEFFDGFAWAVPRAFADSLAACRFEEGDTLYDHRRAYEGPWGDALPYLTYTIQIKAPTRGAGTKTDKEQESVFTDNWNTPVNFALSDCTEHTMREVTSTQGRLYSLLWKGELRYIDHDEPSPPVPSLATQVLSEISRATDHVRRSILNEASNLVVFMLPYDPTRQLFVAKFHKVQGCLKGFNTRVYCVEPAVAGIESETDYAPTVYIACFCIEGSSEETVKQALKKALYTPAREKKTSREQFRLTAHGHLFTT